MILGKIFGKVTTNQFYFKAINPVNKFDFIQVYHKDYGYILSQIIELERKNNEQIAKCNIIGYKDGHLVKQPRNPLMPGTEVLIAERSLIEEIVKLDSEGAYIGFLDGTDIKINLDLNKLLTKHLVILAKSGAGKSYTIGVLLEEIIEKNVPLIIIDPHGEYVSLKNPNEKEKEQLKKYGLKPQGYLRRIREYGDIELDNSLIPLKINSRMNLKQLLKLIPVKISNNQLALLYDSVRNMKDFTLNELLYVLEQQESNVKWSLISIVEHLQALNIFSESPTDLNELIQPGRCSIINLKGMPKISQELIVAKLLSDLFLARKKETIPPFFCVIEEAHNFCPERSFGETKASTIIRDIASEGRKFGLGLAVISQRPARLDKSVISQCTTQIILKLTNPNDLKTIQNSVEGITQETISDIKNLSVGSAMVCGVVDIPLFVNIRPRKTEHGGEAVEILNNKTMLEKLDDFESENKLPLIYPNITFEEFKLMYDQNSKFSKELIPAVLFHCKKDDFSYKILAELIKGKIVLNLFPFETAYLPNLEELSVTQIQYLGKAFQLKNFHQDDFIKSYGVSLDSIKVLDSLVQKKFLNKINNIYSLNKEVILGALSEFSFNGKIVIEPCSDKILSKMISIDYLKKKVSKFTHVEDLTECYIVNYRVEIKDK